MGTKSPGSFFQSNSLLCRQFFLNSSLWNVIAVRWWIIAHKWWHIAFSIPAGRLNFEHYALLHAFIVVFCFYWTCPKCKVSQLELKLGKTISRHKKLSAQVYMVYIKFAPIGNAEYLTIDRHHKTLLSRMHVKAPLSKCQIRFQNPLRFGCFPIF